MQLEEVRSQTTKEAVGVVGMQDDADDVIDSALNQHDELLGGRHLDHPLELRLSG